MCCHSFIKVISKGCTKFHWGFTKYAVMVKGIGVGEGTWVCTSNVIE